MRVKLRNLCWRLVDILSSLERPQKTGRETEYCNPSWPEPDQLKLAIHYLAVSARHFRLGGVFLRLSVKHCANSVVNSSKTLMVRGWHLFCGFRQSKGQISRCSCPSADTQNQGLSNAKNIDVPGAFSDSLNPCPKSSKSVSGGNTKKACFSKPVTKPAGHRSEGDCL